MKLPRIFRRNSRDHFIPNTPALNNLMQRNDASIAMSVRWNKVTYSVHSPKVERTTTIAKLLLIELANAGRFAHCIEFHGTTAVFDVPHGKR